jgi:hypothetical protein
MQGRSVVVVLHETVHKMQQKNLSLVIFKIYFEKACDKVQWTFLQQTLRIDGFSPK